uniref:Uncharacterized protein n=1 Tax=Chromera velia CCMP2878 TaxID=1169474 RepID=A0A0G4FPQ7_9ALVE|eukprot:Cvel_3578.t1-p1 / transcript=Cvel_3578.t1 / gene=Cvel_3578 / organism=Chromera_velia_CCMP2878 / gene_product=hypothetical protein / transcript_product=hypothetical protein / location=Cvel_scaffold146:74562-75316(+) / protein_length=128 / sequence_SO=supercontig / SO=protein_coding / is_pseudo=false
MPATNIPGVLPAELVLLALNLALHDNKQKAFSVHTFAEQQQLVELDRLLQCEKIEREERRRSSMRQPERERKVPKAHDPQWEDVDVRRDTDREGRWRTCVSIVPPTEVSALAEVSVSRLCQREGACGL